MSDKPFDPVTEGTPEEMLNSEAWLSTTTLEAEIPLIAARDAAKKAEGRREGLEEAEEIMKRYLVSNSQRAVSWHEVMDTIAAIRTAAETAKERE